MKSPRKREIAQRYSTLWESSNLGAPPVCYTLAMPRNTLIIGGASTLLILAALIVYGTTRPENVSTGITLPPEGYTEHAKYYDIVAAYATSTPLIGAKDAAARSLMYGFVRDTINEFKANGNFENLTAEDITMMGFDQGRKQTLQINYRVAFAPKTVSYVFTIYEDTLGAHGNSYFRTFTFDRTTGEELALADLFLPQADYFGVLSSLSRTGLPAVIGEFADTAYIRRGTAPQAENFEDFYLEKSSFILLFEPYQVAPYAAGSQALHIPRANISSILKPGYR